jgi:hypothetical protein
MARKTLTDAQKRRIDRLAASPDPDLLVVKGFFTTSRLNFSAVARGCVRQGLDEVIDGRRTRRHSYAQLSNPEKSFCGIRIESALVRKLELPLGKALDVSILGIDVDIKASNKHGWMIGPGQVGSILLLLYYNEGKEHFSVGLLRAYKEFLNPSKNRDAKRTLSVYAKRHIHWLVSNEPLPVSILSSLSRKQVEHILSGTSRAERLTRFLALIPPFIPFPREAVETIVGGTDPLRGTRHDRSLHKTGTHPLGSTRVLSVQRKKIVQALGFPPLAPDEFMKVPDAHLKKHGFNL